MARMGGDRKVYKLLVRKLEQKRPLRRLRCRQEDGIKMDLRLAERVWIGFTWLMVGTSGRLF
jgi:hypothetical protein